MSMKNVERTEKLCNYSLISAKITMTMRKKVLLLSGRIISHAFCLFSRGKLSLSCRTCAPSNLARTDCIDIDVSILLAYNEKGERASIRSS